MTDDAGFFRNLSGLATDWVRQKRKTLQSDPETNVDATGGGHRYSFGGQELTWEDLRDIKDIRDSGGQVAQLMSYKALLNFGEGAEIHAETEDDEPLPEQVVDGDPMTVVDWIEMQFPHLDLMVLELGEDALWYPAAYGELRENRAGEFKDALPAEPWTVLPMQNDQGEIIGYKQRTKNQGGGYTEQTLDADALWSIILNRRSARDKTGISEVLRNKEEIQAFKENEQAINQAIELHGFPQRHVKVGKEDGAPVRDDDLRRVRTIFDPRTTDANTAYFTGQDVDVESLEAENFDFAEVHEMDMRNLTTALGLPLEAGNVGSDGLGSGKPAELRFALLKLAIKANQRSFGVQFVEQIIKPAVREYSPFECPNTITLDIADPLEDIGEVADLINSVGDYMTNAEARRKLDLPEPEDDETAESYRSPADMEAAEEGDGQGGDIGGLFSDGRSLAEVPDNAVSISDRSEAPEDAQVITGPGGGLYYVPGAGGDGGSDNAGMSEQAAEAVERIDDLAQEEGGELGTFEQRSEIGELVQETTGVDANFRGGLEKSAEAAKHLIRMGEADQLDRVSEFSYSSTDIPSKGASGHYNPQSRAVTVNPEIVEGDQLDEWEEEGHIAIGTVEGVVTHEVGHHNHIEAVRERDDMDVRDLKQRDLSDSEIAQIQDELSDYGATEPLEFVAEAYAVKTKGQELSSELEQLYDEFGGPEVPV